MGFGLPAAMGAKLGVPDKEVVAILGDGGFQMTMQELGTIMQNQIGLKMIVVNNTYLGMVRQWQQLFFHKRYSFHGHCRSLWDCPSSCRTAVRPKSRH